VNKVAKAVQSLHMGRGQFRTNACTIDAADGQDKTLVPFFNVHKNPAIFKREAAGRKLKAAVQALSAKRWNTFLLRQTVASSRANGS
jgi:hypothetical protein